MGELSYISATQAIKLFKEKSLSPVELMEATIQQAERVEPVVNALCHQFFDEALEKARGAEQRYAGRGNAPRPLEGIPLAVYCCYLDCPYS